MGNGNDLNRNEPVIDFTTQDADGLLTDLIAYAKATYSDLWTDFNAGSRARLMAELVTYYADLNSFHLNALVNEMFVPTALRRQNLVDLGKQQDYTPESARQSSGAVEVTLAPAGTYPGTLSASTTVFSNGATDEVFCMPISDVVVAAYSPTPLSVAVIEGRKVSNEAVATSTGLANQKYRLIKTPVIDGSIVVRVNGIAWTLARYAVDMAAADQKYLLETDDNDVMYVVFGDGVNGAIPTAAQPITADYKYGGGRRGNLSAGTVETVVSGPDIIQSVTNASPLTGGADKPNNATLRRNIPAAQRVHSGLITDLDIADAALLVPGVAKAKAFPGESLTRTVNLCIAPSGGGTPSAALANTVSIALRTNRMIGQRIALTGPVYKAALFQLLVYVTSGTRQSDVSVVIQSAFSNAEGTGLLDFEQVDFAGLSLDGQPVISQRRLHALFRDLESAGVERLVIEIMTIAPAYRRLGTTTGNGTVTAITVETNDVQRREYVLTFTSATTYTVKERIIGTVKSLDGQSLTDDEAYFSDLVFLGFTTLNPDRRNTTTLTVISHTTTQLNVSSVNMFALTEVGASYYIERTLGPTGTTGVAYNVVDTLGQTLATWTANVGAGPWAVGDQVIVDTYPQVPQADIKLRDDEIPELSTLSLRFSGGIS